jgi:class 3 adenylate cyclase/tetratricopeptide (TPR) repeat protein
MFCDMEGFTMLSENHGPEEAYSIMDKVYEILIHKVHDYEGTVNEMTGDGIMALFGAPIALEDAPERAIRSAHSIHREITKFSDKLKQQEEGMPPVKMRMGIHTGPVVVGTLGNDLRVEFKAVGDTVNLASRVEGLAEPGTTCVTVDTFKLTEGLFRFETLGEKSVKGKEEPVKIYRVIAPSTRRTRFDVSAERGLTPFVGRERELELMLDIFERSKAGRGQAFSIMSEAGVGKSRLLYEFRKAVTNEDVTFLEGRCLSYSRGVAYRLQVDILKANFDIREGDGDSEIREKVKRGLKVLGADEASTLPYLLEFLSVKESGIDKILMSPEARRDRIVEAIKRIILKGSEIRPLILAHEDLHWVDKSSEEVLKYLLESIPGARVLMIFTYRPEFVHTWGGKSYHSQVTLNRLSNHESLIMVSHFLNTEDIDGDLEELILEKTEGVPLFIEEFIRSLKDLKIIERDDNKYYLARDIQDVIIPMTIQDVIMARVDKLPEAAKVVLQTGSVVGREFSHDLIKRVTGLPEQEIMSHISVLKDSELLYERGIYPQSTYIFKHALTQEVLYSGLLLKRKRELHRAIAFAIRDLYPEKLEENLSILASHYYYGDDWRNALEFHVKAGNKAKEVYAKEEAVDGYQGAIEVFERLSPGEKAENTKLILQARADLSSVYFFAAEYEKSIRENEILLALLEKEDPAQENWPLDWAQSKAGIGLALERLGKFEDGLRTFLEAKKVLEGYSGGENSVEMSRCLGQVGWIYFRLRNFREARRWADESLRLAEELNSPEDITLAHNILGASHLRDGNYEKAKEHFEICLQREEALERLPGIASSLYNLGLVACVRGSYPQALEYYQKALDIRRRVGDAMGTGTSLNSLGNVYHSLNQLDDAIEYYRESLEFREKINHTEGVAVTLENLGRALMEKGNYQEAVKTLRRSIEVGEQIQAPGRMSEAYLSLAYTLAATAEYEEARKCAEESAKIKYGDGEMDDEMKTILKRLETVSPIDLSTEKLVRDRSSLHKWV